MTQECLAACTVVQERHATCQEGYVTCVRVAGKEGGRVEL